MGLLQLANLTSVETSAVAQLVHRKVGIPAVTPERFPESLAVEVAVDLHGACPSHRR